MIIEPDDDNISLKSIKECTICLELLNDETLKQLECSHIFHINCRVFTLPWSINHYARKF